MNAKVFIAIISFFVILIASLSGTYYYLFIEDNKKTNYYNNDYLEENKNEDTYNNQEQNNNSYQQQNDNTLNNYNTYTPSTTYENNQTSDIKNDIKQEEKIKENNTTSLIQENKKEEKTLEQNKTSVSSNNVQKEDVKNIQNIKSEEKNDIKKVVKLSPIKEYQSKGKNSKYEPDLSTEYVKVYVLDGKSLTEYRKNLLKNMLEPIMLKSKDYNLTVFIQMLPNQNMKLGIYNKDIIFSDRKKAYKYVDPKKLSKLAFFFDKNGIENFTNQDILQQLNSAIEREEIIKRVIFTGYTDDRGSVFSNHMLGLSRSLSVARYFFPFSEIIEINSLGKDDYPKKDKTDKQRSINRKVEISFQN